MRKSSTESNKLVRGKLTTLCGRWGIRFTVPGKQASYCVDQIEWFITRVKGLCYPNCPKSGLPLDFEFDHFHDWREKRINEPLVFALLWFIRKHFAKKEAFQKTSTCHSQTGRRRLEIHVVSQLLPISTRDQLWVALPEASRSACGDVPNALHAWTGAVERARASCNFCKQTRKVQFVIFYPKRLLPPTHHSKCIPFRKSDKDGKLGLWRDVSPSKKPLRGRNVSPQSQFPVFVWCSETSFFLF